MVFGVLLQNMGLDEKLSYQPYCAACQLGNPGQILWSFCPYLLCLNYWAKATKPIHKVAQKLSDAMHKMLSTMSGT